MGKEINHVMTEGNIVCPYCGHQHCSVDFEIEGDYGGTMKCDECGLDFQYAADFQTTWTTSKPKEGK